VYRTFAGDLSQLRKKRRINRAFNRNKPLEPINLALATLSNVAALRAVLCRDLAVADSTEMRPSGSFLCSA